ncbi:MAG: hypothetical protein QNJ40_18465 [Xanthomonadales bacterium]|nr:hypothetical protein [Xanthomonadales bacterium]
MSNSLPFPPLALAIGAAGAIMLVLGVVGLTGQNDGSLLSDPVLSWSLVGVGAFLVLAETVIIVLALINRPKP